ncbi:NAD(P)-dependent oxidoreductase [Streptomyces nigra]|uniref:NAD(P)-dependent oxidoreductase n=1 Tax=Streptomyces nigra TaxID=1827580 RepID=UPI0036A37799
MPAIPGTPAADLENDQLRPTSRKVGQTVHVVALIGLGRMGTPICAKLVQAGYAVRAHDSREELKSSADRVGAAWNDTAAGAAFDADVLITVLPDSGAVNKTVDQSVLSVLAANAVWIDMTSNAPQEAALAQERARAWSVDVLEAPLGGNPEDAAEGKLTVFTAGDRHVAERCRPLLTTIADPEKLHYLGGPGAGYTAKLLVNLLWFGQAIATAEALLLAKRAGIDPVVLRKVLQGSAAATRFIRHDLPALFAGDYLASYELDRIHAQLDAITAYARELGTPHEVAKTVERLHREALDRYGAVAGELLGVALLEERAQDHLRAQE